MSHGDDRPEYDDQHERFDVEPQKKGMSGCMKAVIILLIIAGIIGLVCCGVGVYFFQKIKAGASSDPAVVQKVTKEIVTMEIPAKYKPVQSLVMDLPIPNFPKMKFAIHNTENEQSVLMLIEIKAPNEEIDEQQFRQQMRKQGQNPGELDNIEQLKPIVVKIKGSDVRFNLQKGRDSNSGREMIQVQGMFKGNNGMVMLMMMISEKEFQRDEVEKMLKSIK